MFDVAAFTALSHAEQRAMLIDTARDGLIAQGVRSAKDPENLYAACFYRDPNGNKCGAGHLIPDELYDRGMDGLGFGDTSIASIVRDYPQLSYLRPYSELVAEIQSIHDDNMPDDWPALFAEIER